ncbi:VOC family protein [Thalassovita sp.]|uniref:VOC family protein n=1 Tax=Thalassovita sp. TaxID=1979401 RepID=UPI00288234AC|nr:VOC family protein [Thalassovita sp.]MDF1802338.1 VOC family protein [Thalassovita sp.]
MTFTPPNAVVWTEIRVSNLEKAAAFYADVLQSDIAITTEMGPQPMAVFGYQGDPGISGHLIEGTPAASGTGNIVHLAIPDTLAETRARLTAAGGTILSPDIDIPPGAYFYAEDPDGNTIGLFQYKD